MKQATLVVSSPYLDNRIFDESNSDLNRDNCLAPFRAMKQKFAEQGVDLATQDRNVIQQSDYVIYNDAPKTSPDPLARDKSYLLAMENPLILKNNVSPENSNRYRRIFTWNDQLIDGSQFIKVNFCCEIPDRIPVDLGHKEKLVTVIAGNKKLSHPLELYSRRVESIRWLEKNAPGEFDLYGVGWDEYYFPGWMRILNRFKVLKRNWPHRSFPSYKGIIDNKYEVLCKYRFSICYENAYNLPGWITEKIFDSMFSGCVPVYWGADNVTDYVPQGCFIDRTEFSTHETLFQFLQQMDDETYIGYLRSINDFLGSTGVLEFGADKFASTVVDHVLADN